MSGTHERCGNSRMRLHSRVVFGVLLMIVGALFVAIVAIRLLLPASSAALPPVRIFNSGETSPAPSLKLPSCPPAVIQPLQPSQNTGHHKVTLLWNANTPTPDPKRNAVGYCLYRSQKEQAAKQNPRCAECEQINRTPIVGVGCVDDLVTDSANYYYVVTAINANGDISSSSNETPARIPANKAPAGPAPQGSYPLCRAPAATP
jgi:hypothetical protein